MRATSCRQKVRTAAQEIAFVCHTWGNLLTHATRPVLRPRKRARGGGGGTSRINLGDEDSDEDSDEDGSEGRDFHTASDRSNSDEEDEGSDGSDRVDSLSCYNCAAAAPDGFTCAARGIEAHRLCHICDEPFPCPIEPARQAAAEQAAAAGGPPAPPSRCLCDCCGIQTCGPYFRWQGRPLMSGLGARPCCWGQATRLEDVEVGASGDDLPPEVFRFASGLRVAG